MSQETTQNLAEAALRIFEMRGAAPSATAAARLGGIPRPVVGIAVDDGDRVAVGGLQDAVAGTGSPGAIAIDPVNLFVEKPVSVRVTGSGSVSAPLETQTAMVSGEDGSASRSASVTVAVAVPGSG